MVGYTLKGVVLPSLVFPVLAALALCFLHGHAKESGLWSMVDVACPDTFVSEQSTPFRISYTGFEHFDQTFCGIITFFHAAMTPSAPLTLTTYFLGVATPLIVFMAVEAVRAGRSAAIAYPLLFGLPGQVVGFGVMMPLYCLLFILSGSATPSPSSVHVAQAHAEAVAFSVFIGSVVPSAALLLLKDPQVTAIWQAFPIFTSVAQYAHLLVRRPSSLPKSGYSTIRATYIASFIVASSMHISAVWPLFGDFDTLKATFLPALSALPPGTPLPLVALQFLQWDCIFSFLPILLASLWFAESTMQLLLLIMWNLIALPLIGPGAAVAGVALWRESRLEVYYNKTHEKVD